MRSLFFSAGSLLLALTLFAASPVTTFNSNGTVPRPSPEYAVKMAGGRQLLLSSLHGKVVAVEFLLTTCPHCQHTSEILEKLYKQYGSQGFEPVGVAINIEQGAEAQIPQFIKEHGITYPVGVCPNKEGVYEYLQRSYMDRMMMPQVVFIDRKGVIQAQYAGDNPIFQEPQEEHLRAEIDRLLKAAPVAAKPATKTAAPTGAARRTK